MGIPVFKGGWKNKSVAKRKRTAMICLLSFLSPWLSKGLTLEQTLLGSLSLSKWNLWAERFEPHSLHDYDDEVLSVSQNLYSTEGDTVPALAVHYLTVCVPHTEGKSARALTRVVLCPLAEDGA